MSFKIGQKVVFTGTKTRYDDYDNIPKINEIVEIIGCIVKNRDYLIILGYENNFNGVPQGFHYSKFRPLDYAFVEDVISNLKKEPILI